jgi:transcriptional regulator with XRE-family HTH domain
VTGSEIRARREILGITQAELGRRIGVTQPAISNWEADRVKPRPAEAARLAAALAGAASPPETAEPKKDYGAWVADRRSATRLTRAELAQRAGISQVQVYNIEVGKTVNPREQTRRAIESALAATPPAVITSAVKDEVEIVGVGDLTDFDPHDRDNIPAEPGVYVFYDVSQRPIYVGEAANIRERVANSHTGHIDKFWYRPPIVETASYVRVSDAQLRRKLEQTLIKFLKSNAVINKKGVER